MQNADFRAELANTDVLMASQHGRDRGYCKDIFKYFTPQAVVISGKPFARETQKSVPDYRKGITANGVKVRTTMKNHYLLTTRRDGCIIFDVDDKGTFIVDTEYAG